MACAGPARDRVDDLHRGRARRRGACRPPDAGPGEGRRARSRSTRRTTPCSVGASGPGTRAVYRRREYTVEVAINRHGLRDPERDYAASAGRRSGSWRWATRSWRATRCPFTETVTQVLESSLTRDGRPAEVINGGTVGVQHGPGAALLSIARGACTRRASCCSSSTTTTSCTTTARNTSVRPSPCSRWEAATFVSTAFRCASAPPQAAPTAAVAEPESSLRSGGVDPGPHVVRRTKGLQLRRAAGPLAAHAAGAHAPGAPGLRDAASYRRSRTRGQRPAALLAAAARDVEARRRTLPRRLRPQPAGGGRQAAGGSAASSTAGTRQAGIAAAWPSA